VIRRFCYQTDEHPDICLSLTNLADIYFQTGKKSEAVELFGKVLGRVNFDFKIYREADK
jgi:hypothetical protein